MLLRDTCVLLLPNQPPSIVILLLVILNLNHKALTIAAKVKGKPKIVNPANKLIIFRSVVPVREIGFLPGTAEEKVETYTAPYRAICSEIFGDAGSYNKLVNSNQLIFIAMPVNSGGRDIIIRWSQKTPL